MSALMTEEWNSLAYVKLKLLKECDKMKLQLKVRHIQT